ncbi:hypothetical protein B0H14DRAFT_2574710 [Mycena olivaceomarginata]|nr:hypothetical protein B0H14DRAFT_2574710 [Mycena olivaceomarginata]
MRTIARLRDVRHTSKATSSSFSSVLAKYDLRERDLHHILTLEWRNPSRSSKRSIKLVSESHVKETCAVHTSSIYLSAYSNFFCGALCNWDSESALQAHLEQKTAEAQHRAERRLPQSRQHPRGAAGDQELRRCGHGRPRAHGVQDPHGVLPILLPVQLTDQKVMCFVPRPMMEAGGEVVLDTNDSDENEGNGANGSEA